MISHYNLTTNNFDLGFSVNWAGDPSIVSNPYLYYTPGFYVYTAYTKANYSNNEDIMVENFEAYPIARCTQDRFKNLTNINNSLFFCPTPMNISI